MAKLFKLLKMLLVSFLLSFVIHIWLTHDILYQIKMIKSGHEGSHTKISGNVSLISSELRCAQTLVPIDPYEKSGPNENYSTGMFPDCAGMHFGQKLPLVALASMPGSGNTWVRHLIQQLTGIYTGTVYHDKKLHAAGFIGEYKRDSTVVAIKTHTSRENCAKEVNFNQTKRYTCKLNTLIPFKKAIVLIRDPYESILAEFNRRRSQTHTGVAEASMFRTKRWYNAGMVLAEKWINHIIVWSQSRYSKDLKCDLLFLSYEQLKTNLPEQLVKLGHFLNVDDNYLKGGHLQCVVKNSAGKQKRSHGSKVPNDVFTPNMIKTIKRYIREANDILMALGVDFLV